jgi:hypothetical protein
VIRAKTSTAVIIPEGSSDLKNWSALDFVEAWQENVDENRERVHYVIPRIGSDMYFLRIRIGLNE